MRQLTFGYAGWLMLAGLMILLAGGPVWAGEVSGTISEDATWTLGSSPYLVTGDIQVAEGVELVIEPGVVVQFQGPYEFRVDGVLRAIGNVTEAANDSTQLMPWDEDDVQWVVFTQDTTGMGDTDPVAWADANADNLWRGIRFNDSDNGSRLQWVLVQFGYARGEWPMNNGGGVYVRAVSVPMTNMVVRYCRADSYGGGVYLWSTASDFRNNLLYRNYADQQGGGMYIDQSSTTLRNLTMVENEAGALGHAIYFGPNIDPLIRSSIFENNPEEGDESPFYSYNSINIRHSIDSSREDNVDLTLGLYGADAAYFSETEFYTVSDSSRAVDRGDPASMAWQAEPEPNGGPDGGRLNMGVWGGTPFGAPSRPVFVVDGDDHVFNFSSTRIGRTSQLDIPIKNIGANLLTIRPNQISILRDLPGRVFDDDYTDAQIDGFIDDWQVVDFPTFTLRPDSVGAFSVIYQPNDPTTAPIDTASSTGAILERDYLGIDFATPGGSIYFELRGSPTDPDLQLDAPDTLAFGEVNIEYPDTLYVTATNVGTTLLTFPTSTQPDRVVAVDFENPSWRSFVPWEDRSLEPGESTQIAIIADAVLKGNITSEATVQYIGGTESFVVSAFAVGPIPFLPTFNNVDLTENHLDFDFVNVDQDGLDGSAILQRSRYIEIKNEGNRGMLVEADFSSPSFSLHFIDTTYNDDGSIDEITEILPQPLPADSSGFARIVFVPQEERTYNETMTLRTKDTLNPSRTSAEFDYDLSGRGTGQGKYIAGDIPNPANDVAPVWGPEELGGDGNMEFIVAGPTRIPAGESITILPGVRVSFEAPDLPGGDSPVPAYFQVEGTLEALGTAEDMIVFAPLDSQKSSAGTEDDPVYIAARHGGLRFLASQEGTRLQHVLIDSGRTLTHAEVTEALGYSQSDPFVESVPHVLTHGGGAALYNCSPVFEDVVISNCYSSQDGGGLWMYQGAPTLIRTSLINNEAVGEEPVGANEAAVQPGNGGGMVIWGSDPAIHACTVSNNTAANNGGGIHITSLSSGLVTNSLISGNMATGIGGVFITGQSNPLLLNDVLSGNTADGGTSGVYVNNSSKPIMRNSVIAGLGGDAAIVSTAGTLVSVFDSFVEGGYANGVNIYTDAPQYDANYMPTGNGSNLVDAGSNRSAFQDYSFPPSLGGVKADVGITGGPYAGYWGSPLHLRVFLNAANARAMTFVVNATDDLESTPSLTVADYQGTDTFDAMDVVSAEQRTWSTTYEVSESSILTVTASAQWTNADNEVITSSVRRQMSVAVYTQPGGASLASDGGSSFTLPPGAAGKAMLLKGEAELSASLPPQATDGVIAGPRWSVTAPVTRFNRAAELEMPYDASVVPAGKETGLAIWRHADDGSWTRLETFVDPESRTVHASTASSGSFVVIYGDAVETATLLPETALLGANYPNPFNPSTTIPFTLGQGSEVELAIFNVMGQRVATVSKGWFSAGAHQVAWNGLSDGGAAVASGVYFYRMTTRPGDGSGISQTRKLVLMR